MRGFPALCEAKTSVHVANCSLKIYQPIGVGVGRRAELGELRQRCRGELSLVKVLNGVLTLILEVIEID
jgi:hypothetical protein